MAQITTYKCDVCGKQKGESNHWFSACLWGDDKNNLLLGPFEPALTVMHFCGRSCAITKVSEFMEQISK